MKPLKKPTLEKANAKNNSSITKGGIKFLMSPFDYLPFLILSKAQIILPVMLVFTIQINSYRSVAITLFLMESVLLNTRLNFFPHSETIISSNTE